MITPFNRVEREIIKLVTYQYQPWPYRQPKVAELDFLDKPSFSPCVKQRSEILVILLLSI